MSFKELKGSNNPEQAPAKTGESMGGKAAQVTKSDQGAGRVWRVLEILWNAITWVPRMLWNGVCWVFKFPGKCIPKFSTKGLAWCLVGVVFVGLSTAAILLNHKRMALEVSLEKAINEKVILQGQLDQVTEAKVSVEKKLVRVEGDLNSERTRAIALDLQLTEAKRQQEEILARIGQQDQLIQEFQGKIQEFQVSQQEKGKPAETALVELEKIIVGHRPRLEGKIIGMNNDYSWVVVNLGKTSPLRQGMILTVVRESQTIGRVQVEEILEDMANAKILSQKEGVQFQVADLVREM